MSEKKVSGVRTDLSPSEFSANMNKGKIKKSRRWSSFKKFLGNFADILSSLGLFPVLKASNSYKVNTRPKVNSSSKNFKENYHVDTKSTTQFDPEKAYIERMQEDAYLKSAGYTKDDLILTEEEYIRRQQEDAYFDSLPGYRKNDSKSDHDR